MYSSIVNLPLRPLYTLDNQKMTLQDYEKKCY